MKKNYIILSEKKWHIALFENLQKDNKVNWYLINSKNDFSFEKLSELKADIVFIPHWSYIIGKEIYENFECIVFHMTDLPFGRGGSPLQNLIIFRKKETMISALRVEKGVDTGDIYLKRLLSLDGKAIEIFERASFVIKEMITEILHKEIKPSKQQGEIVLFKRRVKDDSNISSLSDLEQVYDYIRMLDCEGYPNAFLETDHFRFEFSNAFLSDHDKNITANVRITKK